jgi:hypothetical protein
MREKEKERERESEVAGIIGLVMSGGKCGKAKTRRLCIWVYE